MMLEWFIGAFIGTAYVYAGWYVGNMIWLAWEQDGVETGIRKSWILGSMFFWPLYLGAAWVINQLDFPRS